MHAFLHSLRLIGLAALVSVITGCAMTRVVESNVSSFSALPTLPSPATYKLERLPSQDARAAQFAAIEAQAQQALARVGLQRDDRAAPLSVQIATEGGYARVNNWPYYSADPFYGRFGWGISGPRGRFGWGMGMGVGGMFDGPPTIYHRKVSLVLRDAATQKIVYETSAVYEDVWTDDPAIYGLLFDAALTGFPQPPQGPRVIRTEVNTGRPAAAPAAPPVPPAPAVPASAVR